MKLFLRGPPLFATVLAALCAAGCVEAARNQRLAAVRQGNDAHFNDPDVQRRITQVVAARFLAVDEIMNRAKAAGKKMTAPRVVRTVPPKYPFGARLKDRQGGVWVGFVVGVDGAVSDAESIPDPEAITDPAFVAAALAAVREWKFEPGKADGEPIPFVIAVPVIFQLE